MIILLLLLLMMLILLAMFCIDSVCKLLGNDIIIHF